LSRLLPALASSLVLAGCAGIPLPEVSTLPTDVQEEIRANDPRLEALYEKYHPVPGPGLHLRSEVRKVTDQRRKEVAGEFWVFVSGSW